jgi:hypothetical protein
MLLRIMANKKSGDLFIKFGRIYPKRCILKMNFKVKIDEKGRLNGVDEFIKGDIIDLSKFPDNHFDVVICFGGALSYTCEKRYMRQRN